MKIRIFTGLAISAVLISACTSATKAEPATDLSSYLSQSISWQPCPNDYFVSSDQFASSFEKSSADCATVNVPAIYSGSQTLSDFKIEMMRQPAPVDSKIGTLFINPGGPGGSGIQELQWTDFPSAIRAKYDIVGFDPRGVNKSAPVSGNQIKCSTRDDYETYWTGELTPSNDKEFLASIDKLDAYYRNCAAANPTWWTLSTKNVVSDLEIMRQVITGDEPLNFLGSSYGTTIAAAYITRYPDKVGHIVLDSPTTNAPDTPAAQIAEAKSLEANVMRLVKGYAKASNKSVTQVKKLMLKVRQWGDDNKLIGFAGMKVIDPVNQIHRSNEYMFTHGIQVLTYYDTGIAQKYFNQGLDEVSKNKWNGTFEYFAMSMDGYDSDTLGGSKYEPDKIKRDNSYEVMDIVNSMDLEFVDKTTKKQKKELAKKLKAAAPFWSQLTGDPSNYEYQGKREGLSWTKLAKADASIPDPPTAKPKRTNTSGKKVLVVGSKYESTTPYEFAVKTAADLKSPIVTYLGTEHAPVASFANTCLNKLFIDYLVDDKAPTRPVTCRK